MVQNELLSFIWCTCWDWGRYDFGNVLLISRKLNMLVLYKMDMGPSRILDMFEVFLVKETLSDKLGL